jgi:hypothetical protein
VATLDEQVGSHIFQVLERLGRPRRLLEAPGSPADHDRVDSKADLKSDPPVLVEGSSSLGAERTRSGRRPSPTTTATPPMASTSCVRRLVNSANRTPESKNSRIMAVSRMSSNSLPAQALSRAFNWSSLTTSVSGSGTYGGSTFTIGLVRISPSGPTASYASSPS